MSKMTGKTSNDHVLEEIHNVQEKHYVERKGLSFSEQKKIISTKVSEFEKKHKIKFRTIKPEEMVVSAK